VLPDDSVQFTSQKIRFLANRPDDVSYRPDAQLSKASSVQTTRTFRLDLPLCREASNFSSLHPSRRFSSTSRRLLVFNNLQYFFPKTQLWEVHCNCPDDVDSRSDALIHKASIIFKIQTSKRQSSWSRRASIRYGNGMHQINHPDDHPLGPDERSLGMEITCSGSATVWMTGHHRLDAAQNRKEFQLNFLKVDRTVVRPDAP